MIVVALGSQYRPIAIDFLPLISYNISIVARLEQEPETTILHDLGIRPRDIFQQYGVDIRSATIEELEAIGLNLRGPQSDNDYLSHIRNPKSSDVTGARLAICVMCREMLANSLPTPHFNALLYAAFSDGIESRKRSVWGIYKATDLTATMAQGIQVSTNYMRQLMRGMRVSGILAMVKDKTLKEAFTAQKAEFLGDYEAQPESVQKRPGPKLDIPFYQFLYPHGARALSSFVPYELPYWLEVLDRYRYGQLPFTSRVLQFYQNFRLESMPDVLFAVREETGIPLNGETYSATLKFLSADMPVRNWELR